MNTLVQRYRLRALRVLSFSLVLLFCQQAFCQNPARFQKEIDQFKSDTTNYSAINNLVLFTGSSTMRMWTDLQKDFPDYRVLNRGFGGSFMSELLYYVDTIILQCRPKMIFIYEGDNDIATGKKPNEILRDAVKLVGLIREKLPESVICFVAAKPSPSRWNLKDAYIDFNQQLKELTKHYPKVYYLNIWDQMLDADGNPKPDIFLDDKLHMNRKGYDIWKEITGKFLRKHKVRGKS